MTKRISNPPPPVKDKPPYPYQRPAAVKLTKTQIEGIRLIADLFVIEDITKQVMPTVLNPEQIEQFKQHMRKNCPELYAAQAELQRQINDVRRVWLEKLQEDDWL